MAKASYAPMFETVSGALNKINKKSPHAGDQKMVLATHRKAPTTSTDCSRVYLRRTRSTQQVLGSIRSRKRTSERPFQTGGRSYSLQGSKGHCRWQDYDAFVHLVPGICSV